MNKNISPSGAFYAAPWRSILFSSCPFATKIVSVRNGSQLTGVPWDLRLAGHTSATHSFLAFFLILPSCEWLNVFNGPDVLVAKL